MLFTRCPHCRTTFRITAEALEKAGGHVRCGRCSSIFNAHDALHEDSPTANVSAPPAASADENIGFSDALGTSDDESSAADGGGGAVPQAHEQENAAAEPADDEAATHESSMEADSPPAPGDKADDAWVELMLEQNAAEAPPEEPAWSQMAAAAAPQRRSALWSAGCVLALVALLAQGVNHYRGELATRPQVGALVQGIYGLFGLELTPDWNVHQYRVLKWTATAEPKTKIDGKGALVITARIQNRGPLAQPYPYIHLRLKNRWEGVVGSRTFRPSEYLAKKPLSGALMSAGSVADARLAVVDPGPDAYGFDLDVCVRSARAKFHCADDDVFK